MTTVSIHSKIQELEKYDSVIATVRCQCKKGAWLEFDGLIGFAYTNLRIKEKAYCSIRKINYETGYILLSVDSVISDDYAA